MWQIAGCSPTDYSQTAIHLDKRLPFPAYMLSDVAKMMEQKDPEFTFHKVDRRDRDFLKAYSFG